MEVKYEILAPSAVCAPCYDFTEDGVKKTRVTVIIAPIVLDETKPGTLLIGWACSRKHSCRETNCRYSGSADEARDDRDKPPVETFGSYCDR